MTFLTFNGPSGSRRFISQSPNHSIHFSIRRGALVVVYVVFPVPSCLGRHPLPVIPGLPDAVLVLEPLTIELAQAFDIDEPWKDLGQMRAQDARKSGGHHLSTMESQVVVVVVAHRVHGHALDV